MAVLKCKMCGGDFEVNTESNILECEYCGTKQTIPNVDNEKKVNLFNRANRLRINCEFDKAAAIYENIISEFPEEAEAYWGLCLCNYGIEYVDDPETGNKIPTCHRASFESILHDENYNLAIEYSDINIQKLYRDEAREIDRIMGEILAVSKNEKPYDIFICYKETDDFKNRTIDSVLAYDIYELLVAQGYNVFFSRVTLEDKLGRQYEPYIFAALNSAKVMLSIGTKYEYFHAVWVKNEWSRFLKLMKKDKSRVLIPCYKDMDLYDLPDEFRPLQAQDLGKVGAMQDLLRGIRKIIDSDKLQQTVAQKPIIQQSSSANIDALLKRGAMALEDGDFSSAEVFFEQVLNFDAECANAYLGKLLVSYKLCTKSQLENLSQPFDTNSNYQKVMRFGDDSLKQDLSNYIHSINNRITKEKEKAEETRKELIYQNAHAEFSKNTEGSYKNATNLFASISGYKDSDDMKELSYERALEVKQETIYQKAHAEFSKNTEESYKNASTLFASISGYKDSDKMEIAAEDKIEELRKTSIYNSASKLLRNNKRLDTAISLFESIIDFRDSKEQIEKCKEQIKLNENIAEERKAKLKRISFVSVIVFGVSFAVVVLLITVFGPMLNYSKAKEFMDKGDYSNATIHFAKASYYKDAEDLLEEATAVLIERSHKSISTGYSYTVGLKDNGTVEITEGYARKWGVQDFRNIVDISGGFFHVAGLKSDGTVDAVGDNDCGQCNVSNWADIVAVSAGGSHTVGLKSDGTLVATGKNDKNQCDIGKWKDIVAVDSGDRYTVGLRKDGRVLAQGSNLYGCCNVWLWRNIIAVSAGSHHTVGIKSNGTVVAVGDNGNGQCDVSKWTDIVAVAAGDEHTVGLKADGTVVAVGWNEYGQCDVSGWSDIVAISAVEHFTVGLKSDGTVVAVGDDDNGQCDVGSWHNIKTPNTKSE
ncbi:MAG: TIR domain-containing protein [Ruminococcus sp.]|nr:TIR domain-containing protein [Ruminococcus sp.]